METLNAEGVSRHDGGNDPGIKLRSGLIGSRKFGSSLQVRSWGGGEILGLVRGCRLPLRTLVTEAGLRGYFGDESETDVSGVLDGIVILACVTCGGQAFQDGPEVGRSPLRSSRRGFAIFGC